MREYRLSGGDVSQDRGSRDPHSASYRCAHGGRGGKAGTPSPARVVRSEPSGLAFLLPLSVTHLPLPMCLRCCGIANFVPSQSRPFRVCSIASTACSASLAHRLHLGLSFRRRSFRYVAPPSPAFGSLRVGHLPCTRSALHCAPLLSACRTIPCSSAHALLRCRQLALSLSPPIPSCFRRPVPTCFQHLPRYSRSAVSVHSRLVARASAHHPVLGIRASPRIIRWAGRRENLSPSAPTRLHRRDLSPWHFAPCSHCCRTVRTASAMPLLRRLPRSCHCARS
eukprot:6451376-Prymnesium_polylepis.1